MIDCQIKKSQHRRVYVSSKYFKAFIKWINENCDVLPKNRNSYENIRFVHENKLGIIYDSSSELTKTFVGAAEKLWEEFELPKK